MTSIEAIIANLMPTLNIFLSVAITLEATIQNDLTKIMEIFIRNVCGGVPLKYSISTIV